MTDFHWSGGESMYITFPHLEIHDDLVIARMTANVDYALRLGGIGEQLLEPIQFADLHLTAPQ